jgi:hypothetical protein
MNPKSFLSVLFQNIKVVRFSSGKYAIRKGWITKTHRYLDISDSLKWANENWRKKTSNYMCDCMDGDLDNVINVLRNYLEGNEKMIEETDVYDIQLVVRGTGKKS